MWYFDTYYINSQKAYGWPYKKDDDKDMRFKRHYMYGPYDTIELACEARRELIVEDSTNEQD